MDTMHRIRPALDDRQHAAVHHDGPLRVEGGPATGKTTVLKERFLHLATSRSAPHRILLLVPTGERAIAIRDELSWRLPHRAIVDVPVHTWHAFAYHLVSRYHTRAGYPKPPVLLSTAEQWAVVRELLDGEDRSAWGPYADHLTTRPFVDEVAAFVSRAGARCCTDDDLPDAGPVRAFAIRYRAHLLQTGRLDQPGLVAAAAALLDAAPDVADAVRARFPHVLVDDAHELQPAHHALLSHLAQEHLVLAGEEIQPVTTELVTRYRRPAQQLRIHTTLADEITAAARELRSAHLFGDVGYDEMAVLLAQPTTYLAPLRRALDALGVPYRIAGDGRPLGTEPAARAVLDLCRLALGLDTSDELVAWLLTSPLCGVAPYDVRERRREAFKRGVTLHELAGELGDLEACVRDGEPADATLHRVIRAVDGWQPSDVDVLSALAQAVGRFVEREPDGTMRAYLSSGSEATFESSPGHGVAIMPPAAAAGRGWRLVCVLGVAEGVLQRRANLFDPWRAPTPHQRALEEAAEERRILRTAFSRAAERLVVSCSPGARRLVPSHLLEETFGPLPEPAPPDAGPPLTLEEAEGMFRRTLASRDSSDAEKAAAVHALAALGADPDTWWWTRGYTPGAPLTPDGTLVTSYSRIGKYDNCPLQYVLESVLGLDPSTSFQMKFGSLVHRIIERAELSELPTLEAALEEYMRAFVDHHRADYPNDVFARTFYRAGHRMIRRWWNTERTQGETVAVEYAFDTLDVDGHRIRGRIDRIARQGDGLVLSDYKTSMNMVEIQAAAESLQLAIYYLAAVTFDDLKQHGEPVRMQLVYPGLEYVDRETGERSCRKRFQRPDQARAALDRLRTILADAAGERFDPSPTADCTWCQMKPLCPRYLEGREVQP